MEDKNNTQEVSLNERIRKLLDENDRFDSWGNMCICDEPKAANAIEKLILQEQLELLKNFYYGEDLKDDDILDHYKRVLENAKEHYTNQLNQL